MNRLRGNMNKIRENMRKLYKSFKKHLTLSSILASSLALGITCLFKYSGLPLVILHYFVIDPVEHYIYLISGFVGILSKLGLKGIIEEIIPLITPMKIGDLLNPESPPRPPQPAQPLAQPPAQAVARPSAQPPANNIPGNNQLSPNDL